MAPAVDSAAIAVILRAVAAGDARIREVTTTSYGLVVECDVTDRVLQKLKKEESP